MPYNYVKFQRGTQAAYERLRNKDPDTLYFIYADEQNQYGSLYLGDKLISGGEIQVVSSTLSSLNDVSLNGTLQDGMLLQYQIISGEGKWRTVSLSDFISDLPDNSSSVSIVNSLTDITNPSEGDIVVIDTTMYVYDGNDWIPITNETLEEKVANLEDRVEDIEDDIDALENLVGHPANAQEQIAASGLFADIAAIDSALNNVYTKQEINNLLADGLTHLRYQIVTSINDIDLTSSAIDYTIYLVPKGTIEQNNGYDEYFVINQSLEKIGTSDINLNNYVQTNDSRLLTSEQQDKLDAITLDANDNLVITAAQVSDLASAISSNQFIKSVDVGTFNVDSAGNLTLVAVPSGQFDPSVYALKTEVGNLSALQNRISTTSTLVDEINGIKDCLIWNNMT